MQQGAFMKRLWQCLFSILSLHVFVQKIMSYLSEQGSCGSVLQTLLNKLMLQVHILIKKYSLI